MRVRARSQNRPSPVPNAHAMRYHGGHEETDDHRRRRGGSRGSGGCDRRAACARRARGRGRRRGRRRGDGVRGRRARGPLHLGHGKRAVQLLERPCRCGALPKRRIRRRGAGPAARSGRACGRMRRARTQESRPLDGRGPSRRCRLPRSGARVLRRLGARVARRGRRPSVPAGEQGCQRAGRAARGRAGRGRSRAVRLRGGAHRSAVPCGRSLSCSFRRSRARCWGRRAPTPAW